MEEEAAMMGKVRKRLGRVESLRQLLGWRKGEGRAETEVSTALPAAGSRVSTLERHDPWAFVRRPVQGSSKGGGRYKRKDRREEGREKSQSMVNLVQEGRSRY